METRFIIAALAMSLRQRRARAVIVACTVVVSFLAPTRAVGQERLKIIYSQFTMTNSVTWFAREAGLFERHGLAADLVYVDSTPAGQALPAGQGATPPRRCKRSRLGRRLSPRCQAAWRSDPI